jgi:hypothetical protein
MLSQRESLSNQPVLPTVRPSTDNVGGPTPTGMLWPSLPKSGESDGTSENLSELGSGKVALDAPLYAEFLVPTNWV